MRNIHKYPWAVNEVKLDRAIDTLIKEGIEKPTESQIKDKYLSFAGLVKPVEKKEE